MIHLYFRGTEECRLREACCSGSTRLEGSGLELNPGWSNVEVGVSRNKGYPLGGGVLFARIIYSIWGL